MSQIIIRMHHAVIALGALGLMLFAIPAAYIVGPYIEARFLPVLDNVTVTEVSASPVGVTFRLMGERLRKHCAYDLGQPVNALVERPGKPATLGIVMTDAPTKGHSRPPGVQALGAWTVLDAKPGDTVTFQIRYECHSQWKTVMLLGPWRVE